MTGFARAEGQAGDYGWTWEVKSVNGRNLDVRCRLPSGTESLEPAIRAAVGERLKRGHIMVHLHLSRVSGVAAVRVNRELLEQVSRVASELAQGAGVAPPTADGLLALRGIVEIVEPEESAAEREAREGAMIATLGEALDRLNAARRDEGRRLAAVLGEQLDEIARLAAAGMTCASAQPEAIRARLKENLAALLDEAPALSEERLAQEAAVLIVKADVREEFDRLRAHIEAAREILAAGGAAGRRLDFLAQEFNREANTLCAKAADVGLTRVGLDLKTVIDQFREQVQNLE